MADNITKRNLLEMIQNNKVTPEDALKLYKDLEQPTKGETIYYRELWQEKLLACNYHKPNGDIIIFCKDMDTYDSMCNQIESSENRIIGVLIGRGYEALTRDVYCINPRHQEDYEKLINKLIDDHINIAYIMHMWSMEDTLHEVEDMMYRSIYSMFYLTRALMQHGINNQVRLVYVNDYVNKEMVSFQEGLVGFFRSLYMENARYLYKLVQVDSQLGMPTIMDELWEKQYESLEVKYSEHKRFVKRIEEVEEDNDLHPIPFKQKGSYLITGGAKGIGYICAEYLARKYKAKLVLVGKSKLSQEIASNIRALEELDSEVIYITANVAIKNQVHELVKEAKQHLGQINGVIHSAGNVRDSYLFTKTTKDIQQVLEPKVYGTVYLDEVLQSEALDFFVMFSSIVSVTGNGGQCDYAYANGFMDSYARFRDKLRQANRRHGKTIAINWSPWKDGGMNVHEENKTMYLDRTGYIPIMRDNGMNILEKAMRMDHYRCIVAHGVRDKLKSYILDSSNYMERNHTDIEVNQDEGLHKMQSFLINIFSELLRLPVHKIDTNTGFKDYGIDSIMVNRFNYEIEKKIGQLPSTILYECLNIDELATYITTNHQEALIKLFHENDSMEQVTNQQSKNRRDHQEDILNLKEEKTINYIDNQHEEIAIIGLSGRYPDAENCDELWHNLTMGKDCITQIPMDRWDYRKYYEEDKQDENQGTMNCKWGGFLSNVDDFDASFFNISPREAKIMDPQERLFIETVWHAIEDTGYSVQNIRENAKREGQADIGVYVGVTTNTYMLWGPSQLDKGLKDLPQSYPWSIANRISYLFNFNGPSIPVDTACSSSLTAVHMACESLLRGECSVAVAGGVNLYLHPIKYMMLSQTNMLSPSGRCHSFGENADGFVPGEGVGALVLKPLKKAQEDGDHIYAVVKASGINHGGLANGYTVPNPSVQASLIANTLKKANLSANTISYIEAHGTGTPLGDPIEIAGLTKAFKEYSRDTGYCSIGSLKSNIGHLEAAAGIAAITKVLLQMKYQLIVPTLHVESINPKIDFTESPFGIQKELAPWNRPTLTEDGILKTYPRRAGISSFGAGGANAHIIIEEYNRCMEERQEELRDEIILLSAKNKETLNAYTEKIYTYLEQNRNNKDINLTDIAYTLQVGREVMDQRLSFVTTTIEDAIHVLKTYCHGDSSNEALYTGNYRDNKDNGTLLACSTQQQQSLRSSQDYHTLAKVWASGADINWQLLYENHRPMRLSLPTYPFQKRKYWMDREKLHLDMKKEIDKIQVDNMNDVVSMEIIDESIAVITMEDRENSNMLTGSLYYGLVNKFHEIQNNVHIKAVILTGFDHVFCMGGTQENLSGIANLQGKCSDGVFIYKGLLSCQVPVISAIQGHAMGGGLIFGLFADIIVMSNDSIYSANFTRYGFTPGVGATYVLKDKLGSNLAMEMMFTANEYRGDELKERGASFIFRDGEKVLQSALDIARKLARKPLSTLKVLKEELSGRMLMQLLPIVDREVNMHEKIFTQPSVEEVKRRIDYYFDPTSTIDNKPIESTIITKKNKTPKLILKNKKTDNHHDTNYTKSVTTVLKKTGTKQDTTEPVPIKNNVQTEVLALIHRILHMPIHDINLKLSVKELGMDSISGVEFIRDINKTFGLSLEAVMLYDFANIKGIIQYIHNEIDNSDNGNLITPIDKKLTKGEKENQIIELLEKLKDDGMDIEEIDQRLEDML